MSQKTKVSDFQIYRRLLSYAKPFMFAIALGLLGTILSSATDAGFAYLMKPLLDKAFIARDQQFIRLLPYGIVLAFLIRGGASLMADYFMAYAGRSVVMRFRQEIFERMLHFPARFFDHATSGRLLSTLIYNVDQVAKASTDAMVTVVRESCLVLGFIIVMLTISWRLTLLFFISAPVIAVIAKYSSKRMRRISSHLQESMGQVTHVAEEAIEGYKIIRIYGGEHYEKEKFYKITQNNQIRELKVIITGALASGGVQQVASIVIALMLYFATSHTADITAGGFTSLIASMMAMLKPMRNLTTVNNTIQRGISAAESLFALLDEPIEQNTGSLRPGRVKGSVKFEKVNFSYEPQKETLNDISFEIQAGMTVALVGRSGSGKTTIANLLPRFYDNYEGKILIDGVDTREIHLSDLRHQFAMVSQHVTLFNDTIENNIAYAQEKIDRAKVIEAARAAHALEFIETLPNGFDTLVGDNGILLSGGQRQRLAIARALMKEAPILIFDEATSALDTESERYIQSALEVLSKTKTTFVIAHRLSTIEKADLILVMDKGRIVESGTHAHLLSRQGAYANLYQMQFKN